MGTQKRKRIIDERTSGRDDHPTPRWLVQRISEFGHSWHHILSHFKKERRGIGLDPSGGKKAPVSALSRTVWTGYNKRTRKGVDGLRNPWTGYGLVFCNPPYGRQIKAWAEKAIAQFGSYTRFLDRPNSPRDELIMLVAARVDTRWFKLLWRHSAAVLLFDRRLQFEGQTDPAKFPNAMIYFGTRPEQFRDAFANLGLVIVNVKPTTTFAAIQSRNVRLFFPPLPVIAGTHEYGLRKAPTRAARNRSVSTRRLAPVRRQTRQRARASSRGRRVR